MESIRRGFAIAMTGVVAKLVRPLAGLWLVRTEGAAIAAASIVAWEVVELAGEAARLGVHRGLQRDRSDRASIALASLVVVGAAGIAAGTIVALWLDDRALVGAVATIAVASTMLFFATGRQQTIDRVAGSAALSIGFGVSAVAAHGAPTLGAIAIAAVAIVTTSRSIGWRDLARAARAPLPIASLVRTSLPLGVGELLQLVIRRGDVIAVQLLTGSPAAVVGYAIARELVGAIGPIREAVDQVLTPLVDRKTAIATAAVVSRWAIAIVVPVAIVVVIAAPATGPIAILAVGR
ncbi:MAG TPA: hypothetical protein VGO00_04795, partial [Kofleriaceae bacterium]|nr:hypothetical protein [Kofleriaceae bacterium]